MPDNEEIETTETTDELTEEQVDAELQAELDKLAPTEETEEAEAEDAEDKKDEKPEGKAPISDEEADDLVRQYAKERGWEITDPAAAKKEEEAKEEGRQEANVDLLAGLPDVEVPKEVIDEIDKRWPGEQNAQKREVMYIRAAAMAAIDQAASQKSQEAVAPIVQEREQAAWQAKAQATARHIATKAEVPEAQDALTKLIMELGPDSEERYGTDPTYKKLVDAALKQTVMEVADSLGDAEQKDLPTAERVGGGKPDVAATMDGLTGEAKAMASEIKKDVASGLMTKAEGDAMLKELQKESARQ